MKNFVLAASLLAFSSQAFADHVKGFIQEVVIRTQDNLVLVRMDKSGPGYDESTDNCISWYHEVAYELTSDPADQALYSMLMMSKMSGSKVFLKLDGSCISGTGAQEIIEGRTGVN